jgi:hypothetical protein
MIKRENIANASRTFDAIKGFGYDFKSSVADLIDNSITDRVGATKVDIIFKRETDRYRSKELFVLKVIDNGCGMDGDELYEAMTLGGGEENKYIKGDLSRYGFGMKSASLAHCDVLSVVSKKNRKDIVGARWDLIKLTGKEWTMYELDRLECNDIIENCDTKLSKSYTIVTWKYLSNIQNDFDSYQKPKMAESYYYNLLGQLKIHLGMVFHRFITGSVKSRKVNIRLNGSEIKAWDPFQRQETSTKEISLNQSVSNCYIAGYDNPILIKAFMLPSEKQYSSQKAHKEGSGNLNWNDAQGYYIYRENRIIRYGGYHNTRGKDEHDKLSRISIDIRSEFDKAFQLNVNKNLVQFPSELRNHLKNNNIKFTKPASKRYRNSTKDEKHVVKNRIRNKKNNFDQLVLNLMDEYKISTERDGYNGKNIKVNNQNGTFTSNTIKDFFEINSNNDYEVISENLKLNKLWDLRCGENNKWKVIINSMHPFYELIYKKNNPRIVTEAVDALIFSLAFAELSIPSNEFKGVLEIFKSTCSEALKELTNSEIVK